MLTTLWANTVTEIGADQQWEGEGRVGDTKPRKKVEFVPTVFSVIVTLPTDCCIHYLEPSPLLFFLLLDVLFLDHVLQKSEVSSRH